MKIYIIIFILIFLKPLFAEQNDEFRAVWVITWEHISASRTPEENKAHVRKILDDVQKSNMNAVLWQARQSGTAYYNSSYEPWGYYAGSAYPGYDPLAYTIQEGHKRGIEVHAWFNVFAASSTAPGTPAADNPDWICRDRAGIPMSSYIALSPGLDTVRAYTINVAMELVRNYDIDGLHLDYVRWNEYSNSRESKSYAEFAEKNNLLDGMVTDEQILDLENNKAGRYLYDVDHPYSGGIPSGFGSWEEWWRNGVTEFVRILHDSVQSIKPWVRLSPAALGKYNWSGWQGYGTVYQDAALWFNQGYIDQLTPMHYHWTTASGFYDMLEGGCPQCWSQWIQQGISDGRLFSVGPGSYNFGSNWNNHPGVVNRCRDVNWVDGFQFFSYGSWEDYKYWTEAGETFFGMKTKIRDTGLISSAIPDEPSILITKLDSLNYEIMVMPNVTITDNHWFAVYRSEAGGIDTDTTNIVNIHFGDSTYTVLESFDGLQNYNGTYTYGATTLNRYWNESLVSNLVLTDPIPSFAPTVTATDPMENDTIAVNADITIHFSKEMDISTVDSAITFTPAVNIDQISWSETWPDYHKRMTINPSGNLQFDTDYTLEIDATALDINGIGIDGNGDGTPGDAFYLHFRTKAVDDEGPVVTFTYPNYQVYIDTFDVRDVVTIVFDELINHNSVDDTNIVWQMGGVDLNTEYIITDMNEISIISIGSYDTLIAYTNFNFTLENSVTDTINNPMLSDLQFSFKTAAEHYIDETIIDDFTSTSYWQQPSYSGSTVGIIGPQTSFGYSTNVYLPATASVPIQKKSAYIRYQWDVQDSTFLIREYWGANPYPTTYITFDTTYVLQCYVFGDGSNNKFRFALDEGDGSSWQNHEVSKWVTLDWYGWQLIEWDLSDPNSVGSWIGNGILDMSSYRIDSFQLTWDQTNGDVSGRIYLDNLRVVKKEIISVIGDEKEFIPEDLTLKQNYPNPFNPETTIRFFIINAGKTSLIIYDILGRKVATLVDKNLAVGEHTVKFNAKHLASGNYFYVLESNGQRIMKKMIIMK